MFLPTTARIRNFAKVSGLGPSPTQACRNEVCNIRRNALASLPQESRPLEAWTEVTLGRNFGRKCNLSRFLLCVRVCA